MTLSCVANGTPKLSHDQVSMKVKVSALRLVTWFEVKSREVSNFIRS